MLTVRGTYNQGKVHLMQKITSKKPVDIIVTFLDDNLSDEIVEEPKKLRIENFSFRAAQEATKNVKISLSDAVIEERREQL